MLGDIHNGKVLRIYVVTRGTHHRRTAQHHYNVSILFDCAGVTKVGEFRNLVLVAALFICTGELRENDYRNLELLRHRLDLSGNPAHLNLTTLLRRLAALAELKVVDHDKFDIVLPLHAAGAGAKIGDVETARIIDEYRCAFELSGRPQQCSGRLGLLVPRHQIAGNAPCAYMGASGQHSLRERRGVHFEREDHHGMRPVVLSLERLSVDVPSKCDALGDVHRKGGLSD